MFGKFERSYLEDSDGVVADHVGPREGLGKEQEYKESHRQENSPKDYY